MTARNPWLIAPVVALAAFMEVLDISIANVSLRHIAGDLSAGQDEATWVLTSYLVTNAIILPASGWFSAMMGRKRFFMACIVGFAASSMLCGLATSLPMLIVFRSIQGLTGGGLQPSSQAILADAFPPAQRGMAFALYGMSVVFAPAIGPTLGGWITDTASWRWVFLINVPVGMVLIPLVKAMIHDPPQTVPRPGKIDLIGFGLLAVGLGCLQILLDKGQQNDWFGSNFILALGVVSAVMLIAFVIWELGEEHPVVNLRLLTNRNFATANLLMFVLGVVLYGTTALLPLLVQSLFGYTATLAGMVMTPGGFIIMFIMPIIGKMVGKVDPRRIIVAGLIICAIASQMMAGFTPTSDFWQFMITRVVQGSGLALLFIPINTISFVGLLREQTNQASALINLSRNLGGSFGISGVMTYLDRFAQGHRTQLVAGADPTSWVWRAAIERATLHAGDRLHALAQINALIDAQAALMGYLDDFKAMTVLFVVLIPAVYLMRRPATHH